jgi:hypothetical protein
MRACNDKIGTDYCSDLRSRLLLESFKDCEQSIRELSVIGFPPLRKERSESGFQKLALLQLNQDQSGDFFQRFKNAFALEGHCFKGRLIFLG